MIVAFVFFNSSEFSPSVLYGLFLVLSSSKVVISEGRGEFCSRQALKWTSLLSFYIKFWLHDKVCMGLSLNYWKKVWWSLTVYLHLKNAAPHPRRPHISDSRVHDQFPTKELTHVKSNPYLIWQVVADTNNQIWVTMVKGQDLNGMNLDPKSPSAKYRPIATHI